MFIAPLENEELQSLGLDVEGMLRQAGFIGNGLKVAARQPRIMHAVNAMAGAIMGEGSLPPAQRTLIGFMASRAAGCLYCQAHTAHNTLSNGLSAEKFEAIWDFERSPLYSESERATLRFARDGAQQPSAITQTHYDDLRKFYDDDTIVEILAIVSLFGFFNRWNDALGTTLEAAPLASAKDTLSTQGWAPGKHASE